MLTLFDILNILAKVMSAAILVFSIQRLRRLIRETRSVALTSREAIMTLHTGLFSLTIVSLIFEIVSYNILANSEGVEACRITTAQVWFAEF